MPKKNTQSKTYPMSMLHVSNFTNTRSPGTRVNNIVPNNARYIDELALINKQTKLANDLPESLNILLNGPGTEEFNKAYSKLESWKNNPINKGNYNLRILITQADGRTVVDTSKGKEKNVNATKENPVNENHNTRPVIMRATKENGPQFELKVSNSTGQTELRCSLRMGPNFVEPVGVVSISSVIPEKKDIYC